jgi:hypothetical protein
MSLAARRHRVRCLHRPNPMAPRHRSRWRQMGCHGDHCGAATSHYPGVLGPLPERRPAAVSAGEHNGTCQIPNDVRTPPYGTFTDPPGRPPCRSGDVGTLLSAASAPDWLIRSLDGLPGPRISGPRVPGRSAMKSGPSAGRRRARGPRRDALDLPILSGLALPRLSEPTRGWCEKCRPSVTVITQPRRSIDSSWPLSLQFRLCGRGRG